MKKKKSNKKRLAIPAVREAMWFYLRASKSEDPNLILLAFNQMHKFRSCFRKQAYRECMSICESVFQLVCMPEPVAGKPLDEEAKKAGLSIVNTMYGEQEVRWAYEIVTTASSKWLASLCEATSDSIN